MVWRKWPLEMILSERGFSLASSCDCFVCLEVPHKSGQLRSARLMLLRTGHQLIASRLFIVLCTFLLAFEQGENSHVTHWKLPLVVVL